MKKKAFYFRMSTWWCNEGDFIERSHLHELGADKDTFSAAINDFGSGIYWVDTTMYGDSSERETLYIFLDKSYYKIGSYSFTSLETLEKHIVSKFGAIFFVGYFTE